MFIVLFIGTAVIYGIINYIILPKPQKELTYKELRRYYRNNSLKEYTKQKRINEQLYLLELEENEKTKTKLYKEIDFLTSQIGMFDELERLIEKDLHNGSGNEKANLSRLISIDKQIHAAQNKIDKLNNLLENLE